MTNKRPDGIAPMGDDAEWAGGDCPLCARHQRGRAGEAAACDACGALIAFPGNGPPRPARRARCRCGHAMRPPTHAGAEFCANPDCMRVSFNGPEALHAYMAAVRVVSHADERLRRRGWWAGFVLGLAVAAALVWLTLGATLAFGQPTDAGPPDAPPDRAPELPPVYPTDRQPGDANGDGRVDFEDSVAVQAGWGFVGEPWTGGDANGDGRVDFDDTIAVLSNWLAGYPAERVVADLLHPMDTPNHRIEVVAAAKGGIQSVRAVDKGGEWHALDLRGGRWVADLPGPDEFDVVVSGAQRGRFTIGPVRTGRVDRAGLDGWCDVVAPFPGAPWSNELGYIPRGAQRVRLIGWQFGGTVDGVAASKKAKPRSVETPWRALWLLDCRVVGDPSDWSTRVDVAARAEWPGGLYLERCSFVGVHSLPADCELIRDCEAEGIGSDAGQNARIVFGYRVRGLDKPAGSTAHPDLLQGWFPGGGDFRVWWVGVRGLDIDGQALFLRCPAVSSFVVRDFRITNAGPTYASQVKGATIDYLEFDGVDVGAQRLLVTNDAANKRDVRVRSYTWRDVTAGGGVFIEPGSGLSVPAGAE